MMVEGIEKAIAAPARRRYFIFFLLFLMVMINYIDRANLSIAGPEMAKEFGWSLSLLGVALSALFWVYAPGLLLWGAALDIIGTRRGYTAGMLIWSIASVLTGAITGFGTLLAARCALGAGEAVLPSTCAKVVREWAPARERGWATGLFTAGYFAGPAIGFPICAWLVGIVGWRMMFYILGGITFLFLFVWLLFYRGPENATWLSQTERDKILRERNDTHIGPTGESAPITRLQLLGHRTTWGLVIAQAAAVFTQYLFLTWLPGYLLRAQHLDLKQVGGFSALPFIVALFVTIALGRFSDAKLAHGRRERGGRRLYVVIALLASTAILLIPLTSNFAIIMLLMSISLSGSACTLAMNIALASDLLVNPRYGGLLFGLIGTGSNAVSLLSPIITGLVAQATGDFVGAFLVAGTFSLVSIVSVLWLVKRPIGTVEECQ
jgi:ACS family glucarate transporter-like MFS transporter